MRKYISALAVIALIFIVPFGSWYYLKVGLDYRKELRVELSPQGNITDLYGLSVPGGKTVLVSKRLDSQGLQDSMQQFYDQYEASPTFILLEEDLQGEGMGSKHMALVSSMAGWKESNTHFIAVDTSGQVRATYSASSEDLTRLVEHFAVLLPRPRDKDIKMKDGRDIDAKPSFMKKEK